MTSKPYVRTIFFFPQEKRKESQLRNHRLLWNWWGRSGGGLDALTPSHNTGCWQHNPAPADTASTTVLPAKTANCQPADLIQLLAGFGGVFLNTAFARKKKGDGASGWGKGRIITDYSEAGDINHQQCNIPVFMEV